MDPLYEIEDWRGCWYYKFGSHYTGPYATRAQAALAARQEAASLHPRWRNRTRVRAKSDRTAAELRRIS